MIRDPDSPICAFALLDGLSFGFSVWLPQFVLPARFVAMTALGQKRTTASVPAKSASADGADIIHACVVV
jgi:hypothetical protein